MKDKKRELRKGGAAAQAAVARPPARAELAARPRTWWPWAAAAALLLVFSVYGPAMHGPFLFDDNTLPFSLPNFDAPLRVWTQGVRKLLYFTYWMNAQISGMDPFSYHVVNVLIHCISGGLIFLIVRRLLEWSGAAEKLRTPLAGFAAGVFLLHPVQTEAVAYLAGRSEALSAMLVFAAFAVFLYRPKPAISWGTVAIIILLFVAALESKEHTIVLPALLLLTDFWWDPGFSFRGIARNWKLYVPLAIGAVVAVAMFSQLILNSTTAGFGYKDITWYQYLFTQFRALFVYIGLFVFPAHLTVDWDFPISKTIFDHGAIVGFIALLALAAAAWHFRRRFRLAAYGFFVYLVLISPTSSILPIADPVAERRLYFSMLGLLLIAVDFLSRVKFERKALAAACAAVLLIFSGLTYARAEVWSSSVALWEDTVRKSPAKVRTHFQLASAYCGGACGGVVENQPRCDLAVAEFQKAAQLGKPDYSLLVDWGLAYDCLNRPEDALAKLQQAAALEPTAHVYTQIAKIYAERQQWAKALDALAAAEKADPTSAIIYAYRGKIHLAKNELPEAIREYQNALSLDRNIGDVRQDLARAQALLAAHR